MGVPGTDEVAFYSADPRGVMPLHESGQPPTFHVPRRLERVIRQGRFRVTFDKAFGRVIRACASPRSRDACDPGWINPTIIRWYTLLHRHGHAHSCEAWALPAPASRSAPRLVGGVYGVSLGSAFFAESMFHRAVPRAPGAARDPFDGSGAGQVCLVTLVRRLRELGYTLLDTQMVTPITARFGAHNIDEHTYLRRLRAAVEGPDRWRAPASA